MKRFTKPGLVRLAILVGGVALTAKVIAAKKNQWTGLNETEVRAKVEERLPDRVPEGKRAVVADKVVATMRSRGFLAEDIDETTTEASGDIEPDIASEADSYDEPSD